jgi:formylglycine-generating enzyme required for sulfatase activity
MASFSGFFSILLPMSNLNGEQPAPIGRFQGMTAYGTCDMAGNVENGAGTKHKKEDSLE